MSAQTFPPSDETVLERLADIARAEAGLSTDATRPDFLRARLACRLRATGSPDFHHYLRLVAQPAAQAERNCLIGTLTTSHSAYFREPHHFDHLRDTVLPSLLNHAASDRPLRFWSAGCAAGQEAYSMAMT
ncbi:MAG: hypothetical protein ORN49_13275, partial [Rhodobacteraceae bacterium]|nr:hypothetical protein [Paracoccaceae bacterium]